MSYLTVFQSITDNTFESPTDIALAAENTLTGENCPVRRPLRGIILGKETHAKLSVDTPVMVNSSVPNSKSSYYTTNFLLQSVTETRNEKVQYVSTFGSTYAFFFGEQPRIINCSAVLLNSPDFNWEKEWWRNYEEVLRGTSLTSSNLKATLQFDGQTVVGYLTNCTTIKNAQEPHLVNVNFSMFVESIEYDVDPGNTQPYSGPDTRADYLGVGNIIDRDDRRVLKESTTAAVRRANIKIGALNGGASLGGLMGALNAIDGAITNFIRNARNLLYGRNMVVPRSFVGERASVPIFPEGTGADDLEGKSVDNFFGQNLLSYTEDGVGDGKAATVTLRTNTDGFLTQEFLLENQHVGGHTYFNYDEYVNTPPRSNTLTELYENIFEDSFFGAEFELTVLDINAWASSLIMNESAIEAFSAFGMHKAIVPYVNGVDAATQFSAVQTTQALGNVARVLMRGVFGVATFAYGQSVVNSRKELQASITNPNTGGLDAATRAQVLGEIAQTSLSTAQERIVAEAEAEQLRGNTGTVTPTLAELAMQALT